MNQTVSKRESGTFDSKVAWYTVGVLTLAYLFSYICLLYTSDAADE